MKFYKMDNWDASFHNDGLLYFSQRIQEMLFSYTSHIYRTPVLNTFLLVKEYIKTASLVQKGTINATHLKYILEEFQDAFRSDPIIQTNIKKEKIEDILNQINTSSTVDQEKMMSYLKSALHNYNSWCREYLRIIVPQEREKKKIESGLRSYIPGLIGAGYSCEYIFHYNRKVFSDSSVSSLDSLNEFLDRFDFKDRQYTVYIAIDKKAFRFQDILHKRLNVELPDASDNVKLIYKKKKYALVKIHIEALDERAAAKTAYNMLYLFFRYFNFIGNQKADWLFNTGEVVDDNGNRAFVKLHATGIDSDDQVESKTAGELSETLISNLLANAQPSFPVIDKAIRIHNTAISEADIKNCFLNLWSIFEILFVSDHSESKILEIEKKLIPILRQDYMQSIAEDLVNNIISNIPLSDLNEVLGPGTEDTLRQFILQVIFLPKHEPLRQELYKKLANYPLIRSRLSLISQFGKNRKDVQANMDRYIKRVQWHFKRLYRTRNAIIHAGESPSNLKDLAEHLHNYVDICLLEIMVILATRPATKTISNAIIDIQLRENDMIRCLKINDVFDEATISTVLSLN